MQSLKLLKLGTVLSLLMMLSGCLWNTQTDTLCTAYKPPSFSVEEITTCLSGESIIEVAKNMKAYKEACE